MIKHKNPPGSPVPSPAPPWFAGAAIGLAIMSMASGAMALGTSLALTQAGYPGK